MYCDYIISYILGSYPLLYNFIYCQKVWDQNENHGFKIPFKHNNDFEKLNE